jgi:hypothetical protein
MLWGGGPTVSTPGDGIRETLLKKANRYGDLDAPLVVAVNSLRLLDDDQDAIAALFGSPSVIVRKYQDGRIEYIDSRTPNGVWFDHERPRRTGLSAVVATSGLMPWSLGSQRASLILNPWAARPLDSHVFQTDKYVPADNVLNYSAGLGLNQIYGLSAEWPKDQSA